MKLEAKNIANKIGRNFPCCCCLLHFCLPNRLLHTGLTAIRRRRPIQTMPMPPARQRACLTNSTTKANAPPTANAMPVRLASTLRRLAASIAFPIRSVIASIQSPAKVPDIKVSTMRQRPERRFMLRQTVLLLKNGINTAPQAGQDTET